MKIRTLIYVIILLLVVNVAAISTIVYYRVAAPGEREECDLTERMVHRISRCRNFRAEERKVMERSRREVDSLVLPICKR